MNELLKQYNTEVSELSNHGLQTIVNDSDLSSIAGNLVTNPVWTFRMVEMIMNNDAGLSSSEWKSVCSRISSEIDRITNFHRYIHAGPQMHSLLKDRNEAEDSDIEASQKAVVDVFNSFHPFLPDLNAEKREYVLKVLFGGEEDKKDIEETLKNNLEQDDDSEGELTVAQKIIQRYRKNHKAVEDTSHIMGSNKAKVEYFLIHADAPYVLDSSDIFVPTWLQNVLADLYTEVLNQTPDFLERMELFKANYETSPPLDEDKEHAKKYANYVRLHLVTSAFATSPSVLTEILGRMKK